MRVNPGSINVSVKFYIVQDASNTSPGEPVTGLLFSDIETGGSASYSRQGAARVDLTLITLASSSAAHADGGFIEIDATNMPGLYRCDYPDAAFASGVDEVTCQVVVASGKNAVGAPKEVEIGTPDVAVIEWNGVALGTTNPLPNAVADAAGGLVVSDAGGLDMDAKLANTNEVTVARMGTLTDWLNGGRLDNILDARMAEASISTTAGVVDTVTTLINKTGFSLAATGLDAISSTATGVIEIAKAVWDRVLTGGTHNIADSAGRRMRDLQEFGVYEGGAIWVDIVNGSPGTTDFESGTAFNPVNNMADANTLATSLGLTRFQIAPGSTITLAATQANQAFVGENWSLALGGQDIAGTFFEGASVSGIGTGATPATFKNCALNTMTTAPMIAERCTLMAGTITLSAAGDYAFDRCASVLAGDSTPVIDTGATVANVNLTMPDYHQGIEIRNLNTLGTDEFSISGQGQVIYAASSSGTVNQRGDWLVTNTGGVTIVTDDNTQGIVDIEEDTAEIGAAGDGLTQVVLAATGLDAIVSTATGMVEIAKAVWDRVLSGVTHNITNSAGKRLRLLGGQIFADGTAQGGGNNSIQLAIGDVTFDNQFKRSKVVITAGLGVGQEAIVTSSTASTDTLVTTPQWGVNPDATSEYNVIPAQAHSTVRNGGYDGGFVYIDTNSANTGQEPGVDGTSTNPVNDETDAYAIAANENLTKFMISPNSAIVLPASSTDKTFEGSQYTIDLNGADIDNSVFNNSKSITGTATAGSGNAPAFFQCAIGSVTLPPCNGLEVGFFGTFTIGSVGSFSFGGSGSVFDLPVTIDFGALLNASSFFLADWTLGDVEIQNAGAGTGTYKFQMSGKGELTINANCSATTEVDLHGSIGLTNNGTGITITQDSNYSLSSIVSDSTAFPGADIPAIKTKTDKLTFTSGNDLDANIQKVNDVIVNGTGAGGDEWGP